jgi:hypothetical protein
MSSVAVSKLSVGTSSNLILANALAKALAEEKDVKCDKDGEFVKVSSKDLTSESISASSNRSRRAFVSGKIDTYLCADGFWTTSTSSAMSTTMTMLPLGDAMFANFVKIFDEVKIKKCLVTIDFTEYESLLERSASSATARSFAVGLSSSDYVNRDYYYLQDRPNCRLVSPSSAKRIFRFTLPVHGLLSSLAVNLPQTVDGFYSTVYLNGLSTGEAVAGWIHLATSDTCGVAGVIRVRVQFDCTFRGRRGAA